MIAIAKAKYLGREGEQRRKKYDAPAPEEPKIDPTEKTYEEMVTQHEVEQRVASIPELPEPPLKFQQVAQDRRVVQCSNPLVPFLSTKYIRGLLTKWQEAFAERHSAPTEDELLDEASEMFEQCRHELSQVLR